MRVTGGLSFRPRLVHRIDKDTTGAVVVAKNLEAERALRQAFEAGTIRKSYLALVEGGAVPLGRRDHADRAHRSALSCARAAGCRSPNDGKPSKTRVRHRRAVRRLHPPCAASRSPDARTQIRVHLSHDGFPLVVDRFYGRRSEFKLSEFKAGYRPKRGLPERPLIDRLTLHAHEVVLPPLGARTEPLEIVAPVPRDLERVLKQLRKVRPSRH